MSKIVKNYFRVLEVVSSLGCELKYKSGVGRKNKMTDLEVVALSLTAEFMSIDSENSLFKEINEQQIPNLIERSQFNKRRRKLFFFLEEVRTGYPNQWYAYRNSLDNTINDRFSEMNFVSIEPSNLLKDWNLNDYPNEGQFNESHIHEKGFIVTDRTYMNNIEVADLIKITNDEILFYHVKKGLGQDMRVLSSQIINASRYLKSAIDELNCESLKKYYNSIIKKHYSDGLILGVDYEGNNISYTEEEFISVLKSTKKKSFVFVYASNSNLTINNEIMGTNSRIAKLALLYTLRDMKRTDFELKIQRINLVN